MKPKLRFYNFTEEWKEIPLGEVGSFRSSGVDKKIYKGESIVNLLNYMDVYNMRNIDSSNCHLLMQVSASEKQIKECTVEKNDVFFTPTSETAEDIGHVMVIEETLPNTCYSYHLMRFRPNKDVFCSLFPNWGFQTKFVRKQMFLAAKGVQRMVLGLPDFENLHVRIPSLEEQNIISSYFRELDKLISEYSKSLASLKQVKEASLQAMFPQEGETVPKIRFKGFEGEWKKESFKDITYHAGVKNKENLPLESYSISNEFGFIPQSEQFENGGTMSIADKRMYYIVSPQSFAYNPARINVGSLGYYEGNNDVIVSSLYEVFKTSDSINDKFLQYWFTTTIFKKMIEQYQEGGVRLYFFYDKLCKCVIWHPCYEEQQAIASYFTALDRKISLHSQRLEKLKQIKAACLDKMFV